LKILYFISIVIICKLGLYSFLSTFFWTKKIQAAIKR
jgi:hypothetical protein